MKGILFSKVNLLLITAVLITSSWIEEKITADHVFSQEMPNKNNVLVIKAEHAYQNIEIQTSDTILVKPSIRYRKGIKKCVCQEQ